jgi:hypothetical protein
VKIRPREAADQAAAQEFLARHNSLRGARLGELVHPPDHPALVAEGAGGHLLGMLTYVPGHVVANPLVPNGARINAQSHGICLD